LGKESENHARHQHALCGKNTHVFNINADVRLHIRMLGTDAEDEAKNVIVIYKRCVQEQVIRHFLKFRSSPFVVLTISCA